MKLKLKDTKGNIFVLVMFALAIVTIFIGTVSIQLSNQIKYNKNEEIYSENRYISEAGVENIIAQYIRNIKLDGSFENKKNSITQLYLNIVKQYLLEAKYVNVDINNSTVNKDIDYVIIYVDNVLPIIDSDIFISELSTLKNKLNRLSNINGIEAKVKYEIYKAQEYINKLPYISDNIGGNLDKNLIRNIELCKNHTLSNYYNVISIYEDIISKFNSNKVSPEFINDLIISLSKIEEAKSNEILNLDQMNKDYDGNNNDYMDIYYNRIQISIMELKLIKNIILYESDNESKDGLYLYIDDKIKLENIDENYSSEAIKANLTYSDEYIEFIENVNNKSKYKIKKKNAHIIIPLEIKSTGNSEKGSKKNYNIESKVKIIIDKIQSDEEYQIRYEIVDWKNDRG
ncbi:MAG: hypothetical protein RSD22_01650 [Romboutsia sp.]